MDVLSAVIVVLSFVSTMFAAWFLVVPFFYENVKAEYPGTIENDTRTKLLETKEQLLRSLEELELDNLGGKIGAEETYRQLKNELSNELAQCLNQLKDAMPLEKGYAVSRRAQHK